MSFASPQDPYRDLKKRHRADKIGPGGQVSALCFKRPRPIDLRLAGWTTEDGAVTCKACLREMKRRQPAEKGPTE